MAADFKEYTRLRDIAQKRQKRLQQAGLAPAIHIPTVKEIKAGLVDANIAFRELKNYLSDVSTVKAARSTGTAPTFKTFPQLPPAKPTTEAEKKQRKREQDRRSRQRARIRREAPTPEKFKKYESYLKALNTFIKTWEKALASGVKAKPEILETLQRLRSMTPTEAQAFVEYMDYRFSQGDFTQHYVIDEFMTDFSKVMKSRKKNLDIIGDFNKFLEDRKGLQNRADSMEGMSAAESMRLWDEFVNR